jgi:uncharacterized membrane protein YfcA
MNGSLGLACAVALLAGLIDAVAGGGGLVQLPGLLALYPGVAVPVLLGTNKVASVFGTSAALLRYVRSGVVLPWRALGPAIGAALVGSFGGARLAALFPSAWMRPLVLVLLIGVVFFLQLRRSWGAERREPAPGAAWKVLLLGAGLGLYDGFFGPGTGTFLLLGLIALLGLDFLGASAGAKALNVATNLAAIAAFASQGQVRWEVALPMAAANIAGSQLGSRLAIKQGAPFVRRMFLGVVVALLGKLAWELLR